MFIGIISTPFPATFGTTTVLDLAISTLSLCLHFSACNHKTEDKKHFIWCSFFFLWPFLKECIKQLKLSFFSVVPVLLGGPLKHLHLAEGHLRSFPVMQVMKPGWQTLTSRSLLSIRGWGEQVLKSAIYSAVSRLHLLWPGRTAAHSHGADKTITALPSTVEMLQNQTFMLLPDDISFPAGIDSLKQSPLHLLLTNLTSNKVPFLHTNVIVCVCECSFILR